MDPNPQKEVSALVASILEDDIKCPWLWDRKICYVKDTPLAARWALQVLPKGPAYCANRFHFLAYDQGRAEYLVKVADHWRSECGKLRTSLARTPPLLRGPTWKDQMKGAINVHKAANDKYQSALAHYCYLVDCRHFVNPHLQKVMDGEKILWQSTPGTVTAPSVSSTDRSVTGITEDPKIPTLTRAEEKQVLALKTHQAVAKLTLTDEEDFWVGYVPKKRRIIVEKTSKCDLTDCNGCED